MPFVLPPPGGIVIGLESFELDGLELNDNTSFNIRYGEVDMTPPRQRPEWIGAADSEWQALVRNPLHENRVVVLPLQVAPGADKDVALNRVGTLQDMLATASQTADGIPLVWSPRGSARTITFDVLAGEITELPLDWSFSAMSRPRVTVTLTCKPYWRGVETLTSTASSGATPFATLAITNSLGEVPGLGRLIVTDTATQARRLVEWGLEGPLTYNAATALIIDSDSMITSGFAGTGSTQSGAYDPGAAGNNVVLLSMLGPQAMCGFSGAHSGVFRVKGRFFCGTTDPGATKIRLVWKDQDNPQTANSYVRPVVGEGWNRLDLGTINVSGAWSGFVEASSPYYTENLRLDFLELVPVGAGYGKARATYAYQAGVTVGRDEFTTTTAGNNLNARVAPAGGTWATSGAATDFQFADDLSGEQIKRSTVSDGGFRWAILGASTFTNTEVRVEVRRSTTPTTSALWYGVIARWTDSSNYLRASVYRDNADLQYLYLHQRVAGADTLLVGPIALQPTTIANGAYYRLRLIVYASGRTFFRVTDAAGALISEIEATSTALATGGALASGKPGFFDQNQGANVIDRHFDNFVVATPAAEPIVVYSGRTLTVSSDDTVRQNSGGTASGHPPSYHPAGRFLVPVGTSRVFVAARRNDTDSALDDNVTDATQIQVGVTPRGLAVPRS